MLLKYSLFLFSKKLNRRPFRRVPQGFAKFRNATKHEKFSGFSFAGTLLRGALQSGLVASLAVPAAANTRHTSAVLSSPTQSKPALALLSATECRKVLLALAEAIVNFEEVPDHAEASKLLAQISQCIGDRTAALSC